jgi:hypothetical protein
MTTSEVLTLPAVAGNKTPVQTKRPKRVSFEIDRELAEAVAALRIAQDIDPDANTWIYNWLVRRGLHAWLEDSKSTPRPWAEINAWFEANPEAEEITTEETEWLSPMYSAIQDEGDVTGETDEGDDIYTVLREDVAELLEEEAKEVDRILAAHRIIRGLLNVDWRYREMEQTAEAETQEAAQ